MSTAKSTVKPAVLPPVDDGDSLDGAAVQQFEPHTQLIARGEIDSQIATARKYPRAIAQSLDNIKTLACLSEDVAASMYYKLRRKAKGGGENRIEGPSIRFAEVVATQWKNMRVASRTVNEDDRFVYVQGFAWDLENNVAFQVETRRRITGSDGKRFNEDMIGVTANAAGSIARRNAVFSTVPRAIWEPILQQAKKVAVGDQKSLAERKAACVAKFAGIHVTPEQLAEWLEINSLDEMTFEHLEDLIGLWTGLKEGTAKVDEEFPPKKAEGEPTEKAVAKTLDQVVQEQKGGGSSGTTDQGGSTPPRSTSTPEPQKAAETAAGDDDKAIDREIAQREGLPLGEPTEPVKGKEQKTDGKVTKPGK